MFVFACQTSEQLSLASSLTWICCSDDSQSTWFEVDWSTSLPLPSVDSVELIVAALSSQHVLVVVGRE